jgi:hypothetical protein
MALFGHQLPGTFADTCWDPAAQEAPMVQEKLQQTQVRVAQLPAQGEIISKP